ncbi:MAG TPA: 4a-hydroxytetrahydrobiopterin dehydratase [Acidisarcina sp.]
MGLLSAEVIEQELQSASGWRVEGLALTKNFSFRSFAEAIAFLNNVAAKAETANHHPDMDVRYDKVIIRSSSHDVGGITRRDFRLAIAINAIYALKT